MKVQPSNWGSASSGPPAVLQHTKKGAEGHEPTAEESWALLPGPGFTQPRPNDTSMSISLSFDIRKIYIVTYFSGHENFIR